MRTWCAHIDARYSWADVSRVAEDNEFYLFIRPGGAGVALPKRVLDDTVDADLRELVRSWSPDGGTNLARELHGASPASAPA